MIGSRTLAALALSLVTTDAANAHEHARAEPSVGEDRPSHSRPSDPDDLSRRSPTLPSAPVSGSARPAPPSVLAILAHPDDEITIAPVLARIARIGGKVTLIFATSGDAGPGSSGLEKGAELAKLREREGRCAAFALGLAEPTFWRLGDGRLSTLARAPDSAAKQALALVDDAISGTKPKVIMTWGPDGGYGHSDHRMISALVTQVVARMGTNRPDLLYAAFPQTDEEQLPQFESWATTHPDLLTDYIGYRPTDLNATEAAMRCYESQFPEIARRGLVKLLHERVWRGNIHFRLAFPNAR